MAKKREEPVVLILLNEGLMSIKIIELLGFLARDAEAGEFAEEHSEVCRNLI